MPFQRWLPVRMVLVTSTIFVGLTCYIWNFTNSFQRQISSNIVGMVEERIFSEYLRKGLPNFPVPRTINTPMVDLRNVWKERRETFLSDLKLLLERRGVEEEKVVALIRNNIFPPPVNSLRKLSVDFPPTVQAQVAMNYFKNKRKGFYVECGAYDGEISSNTVSMEKLGWEGLLIEADPYYFLQALGKNRRVWLLNAALSPTTNISNFGDSGNGYGQLGKVIDSGQLKVPSFPLKTVLRALNKTRIDFFSLDVEGVEFKVLKSLPYNDIEICAITMEYKHNPESPSEIIAFMDSVGFIKHKQIDSVNHPIRYYANDLFFVRKIPCTD